MEMPKTGLTWLTFYICFLLALGVSVGGDDRTQPTEIPTSFDPSSNKADNILPRTSLSQKADVHSTSGTKISDLLDDNLHNGSLTLDFSKEDENQYNPSAEQILVYLLSPDGELIRDTIREIIVPFFDGEWVEDNEGQTSWRPCNESLLVDFVAKVNNFRWQDGRVPKNLVAIIEYSHPNSCLHLESGSLDVAAARSPVVCSITARALDSCTRPSVWPSISNVLAMSSRIRSLTVRSSTCGCVMSWPRQALDIYDDTRFPALEELRLIGYNAYDFHGPAAETSELRRWTRWNRMKLDLLRVFWKLQSTISGTPQKTNLEAWHEAMDWTNLRVLELNRLSVNTLNSFNWPMPSLKSFRSDLPEWWKMESPEDRMTYNEALLAFVSRLPPRLESLGFRSFYHPFPLQQIADIHGQSLKSLELRGGNGYCKHYFNDTDLEQIREQFPALEHLEIDLYRNETWPNGTLDTLVSFPRLTHLTLWLELGNGAYKLPLLTNSTATSLFHRLRAHKNGTDLTHATFYLGDYDGYPSRGLTGPAWSNGRLAKVECSAERGAAPKDGCCRFDGYDPSRPKTADWDKTSWGDSYSGFYSLASSIIDEDSSEARVSGEE